MKLIGLMPVRNEDWVLGLSLRAALMWCDEVIVLLHACTDDSEKIADEVANEAPGRVHLLYEDDHCWTEMAHRQLLLETARYEDATHIAMVDADEVLTSNLVLGIRDIIEATTDNLTLQLPWQCLRGSTDRVHTTGTWGTSNVCMAFRDWPMLHWAAENGYDFHHRHPFGRAWLPCSPIPRIDGGLMHLQFLSDRRLRAKQALYQLTERLRWPDREKPEVTRARYSLAVYGNSGDQFGTVPAEWWDMYQPLMRHLHIDAVPWQEAECRRILHEHPGIEQGLDMFGITG